MTASRVHRRDVPGRTWTGMTLSIFTILSLRALISSSFMLFCSFTSCRRTQI